MRNSYSYGTWYPPLSQRLRASVVNRSGKTSTYPRSKIFLINSLSVGVLAIYWIDYIDQPPCPPKVYSSGCFWDGINSPHRILYLVKRSRESLFLVHSMWRASHFALNLQSFPSAVWSMERFWRNLFFRTVAPSILLWSDEEIRSQLMYVVFCDGFAAWRASHSHKMKKSAKHGNSQNSANCSRIYLFFSDDLVKNTVN